MHVLLLLFLVDWQTEFRTAEAYLAQGSTTQAKVAFERALSQSGGTSADNQAAIHDALGRTEFASGRFRNAQRWFEKAAALATEPAGQAAALGNLARSHLALGELRVANTLAARAADLLSSSPSISLLQGQISFRLGDLPAARRSLQKAVTLGAGSVALADLAFLSAAPNLLEEIIDGMPPGHTRARALRNLGLLQWRNGDRRQAVATLHRTILELEAAVGPTHPDLSATLTDYAEALEKIGRKTEAREVSRRAALSSNAATVDWRDLQAPRR